MIDEAAEVIAVTLLQKAYEHLPPKRVAGAVSLANTAPMSRALKAITLEAYAAGLAAGERKGRRELAAEMEADWKPVAERARKDAIYAIDEQDRLTKLDAQPAYTGGPVETW